MLRAEQGDKEAKEILIRHNLRLVAHIAKKYANYGDNDELISVGSIGLIKAVESFRHDKGTQLATYASRCIENEILMTMRTSKKHRSNVSLSEPVGVDRDGNELTIMDMLADTGSVIEDVESNMLTEQLTPALRAWRSARSHAKGSGGEVRHLALLRLPHREARAGKDTPRSGGGGHGVSAARSAAPGRRFSYIIL